MSFRTRVAVLVAAVVAVVGAGLAGTVLYLAMGQALESVDAKLRSRAADVAQLGDRIGDSNRFDRRPFGRYSPDDVLIQIFDAGGRIWVSNVEPMPIDRTDRSIARRELQGRLTTVDLAGQRMRVLTIPLKVKGRAVMVARPMDDVDLSLIHI